MSNTASSGGPKPGEIFRLPWYAALGYAIATPMFVALAILSVCLIVLKEPERHGFQGELGAAVLGFAGLTLFGGMACLGVYGAVASLRTRVVVEGTSIYLRSAIRDRRFESSNVDQLAWKTYPRSRLEFFVSGERTKLELREFCDVDRLRMIRLFRGLIAEDKQVDWPLFCHKVALPLRDGRLAGLRGDPVSCVTPGKVLITRRRYDRFAMFALPAIALAAVVTTRSPKALSILPVAAILWLLFRFSVRREGELQPRIGAVPGERVMLWGLAGTIVSAILANVVRAGGFSRDAGCIAAMAVLLPSMPFFFIGLHRAEKQKRRNDEVEALSAPDLWQNGEP